MKLRDFTVLLGFMLFADVAWAGAISVGPRIDWSSRNYTVHLDAWSTDQVYGSSATGTGAAGTGECGYITTDQRLNVSGGGAWGEASRPAGHASAASSCQLDFQLTVLEVRPAPEPAGPGFGSGYEVWTTLDLDPANDTARYGWEVGVVLDSLDRDFHQTFGASADTPGCEPYFPGDVRSYPCVNWDMHAAILGGFQPGERVSGRMFARAFVDLRTVPEPSVLALLLAPLLVTAMARRTLAR